MDKKRFKLIWILKSYPVIPIGIAWQFDDVSAFMQNHLGINMPASYSFTNVWLVAIACSFGLAFIHVMYEWNKLRREFEPKIEISNPIERVEPKGAIGKDATLREWRLKITNISASIVKNCYVKQASFINKDGNDSDINGITFKLNTEHPKIIQSHIHKEAFDLSPRDDAIICISGTNRNIDLEQQNVIMLYAIQGKAGEGIGNLIPCQFFPHHLTLRIGADNILKPIEKKYCLFFDDNGILKMEEE